MREDPADAGARTADEDRWLTPQEQASWRSWLSAVTLLMDRLNRDLIAQQGLSTMDYEILVRLSETSDRRIRMSDLAELTLASRSRLSHQVDRMERAGLVERESCEDDRRGAFAVLTEAGWQRLVQAAPDHVRSVRHHLVDALTPEEFAALGAACRKIADGLESD
ncbi:MAG: MarR family winged helix-turn-helix transcriptional regulator [Actinomycetales bacterium]